MIEAHKRKFTGIFIPAHIVEDVRLNAIDKMLYAEVTHFDDNGAGTCWASNEYFAKLLGTSVPTIVRSIARLKELNIVHIASFDGRQRHIKLGLPNQNDYPAQSKRLGCQIKMISTDCKKNGDFSDNGAGCGEPIFVRENSIDNNIDNNIDASAPPTLDNSSLHSPETEQPTSQSCKDEDSLKLISALKTKEAKTQKKNSAKRKVEDVVAKVAVYRADVDFQRAFWHSNETNDSEWDAWTYWIEAVSFGSNPKQMADSFLKQVNVWGGNKSLYWWLKKKTYLSMEKPTQPKPATVSKYSQHMIEYIERYHKNDKQLLSEIDLSWETIYKPVCQSKGYQYAISLAQWNVTNQDNKRTT